MPGSSPCAADCTCGKHTRPPDQRVSPSAARTPEARSEYNRAERTREMHRAWKLKDQYGITPEEYDKILAHQGWVCFICQRPPKPGGKRLSVDHDHTTGLTRGLLCWGCNSALGKFRDSTEKILRAAAYINDPPATAALGREVFGRTGRITKKRTRRKKA